MQKVEGRTNARTAEARWFGIAPVVLIVVWLPIILLGDSTIHRLTFDDAWYYFTIARHIADGGGSTFDGLHTTNGYHPLWMLVCVIPYQLGLDGTGAVRALLIFQLGLWATAVGVLGQTVLQLTGVVGETRGVGRMFPFATIGWMLLVLNPFTVKLFVNGMESGLAALLMAVLLRRAVSNGGDPVGSPLAGGLLLGLLFLARTDTVFIGGAALLWCLILDRHAWRRAVGASVILGSIGLAYMVTNVALVGHPMQISGVTKRVPLTTRGAVEVLVCALVALATLVCALRVGEGGNGKLPRTALWFSRTGWFVAGSLGILAYDWGFSSELFLWHYGPPILWALCTIAIAFADLLDSAAAESEDPTASRAVGVIGAIVVTPLVLLAWLAAASFTGSDLPAVQLHARATGEWIDASLPSSSVIGSFDAGVLGYFTDRNVVNLDGLVNSFEWRDARMEGTSSTNAFLRSAGVTHLANQGDPRDGDDAGLRQAADALIGPTIGSRLLLVHREDFTFSNGQPYTFYVFELPRPAGSGSGA